MPELSVELLGSVASLKGRNWTTERDPITGAADQSVPMVTVDGPHKLMIGLPGGRTLRHWSKLTFFNQMYGKVLEVTLIPHVELLPYQQAVAELEQLLKAWNANPKEQAKSRLAEWKASGDLKADPSSLSQSGGAILRGEDKADLFFQIRPGDNGWFVSVTVQATVEVSGEWIRAHVGRPATGPTTKPAAADGTRK